MDNSTTGILIIAFFASLAPTILDTRWSRQGFFRTPTFLQSTTDTGGVKTDQARPFRQTERSALVGNQEITSPVLSLFSRGSPSHVRRLVIPIIVNAVETMKGRRSAPHVGKEGQKAIPPPVTNRDTPTAVVRPMMIRRGQAAILNAAPYTKFRRFASVDRLTVGLSAARMGAVFLLRCQIALMDREFFTALGTVKGTLERHSNHPQTMIGVPCPGALTSRPGLALSNYSRQAWAR